MPHAIALVMIVRNEARCIERCLRSAAPSVDEMLVLDTGSTDATRELAAACGARVLSADWPDDFSAARNRALALTDAPWRLILDADEWIDGGEACLAALRAEAPAFVGLVTVSSQVEADGAALELHLSTHLPADLWIVELRQPAEPASLPFRAGRAGERLSLPGGGWATLLAPYRHDRSAPADPAPRLWVAALELLRAELHSGRTHQIRVHMHAIGHPLAGDPVYGGKAQKVDCKTADILHRFTRQALHAWKLGLIHPRSELPLEWEIPSPDDMKVLLQQLRQLNHTNL